MDKDRTQDTSRCTAAHVEDSAPCIGPRDAVTILDAVGGAAPGCEFHGARMLASIDGARVEPGSVVGAATRVLAGADSIRPWCWYEAAQLSRAESRANATR